MRSDSSQRNGEGVAGHADPNNRHDNQHRFARDPERRGFCPLKPPVSNEELKEEAEEEGRIRDTGRGSVTDSSLARTHDVGGGGGGQGSGDCCAV